MNFNAAGVSPVDNLDHMSLAAECMFVMIGISNSTGIITWFRNRNLILLGFLLHLLDGLGDSLLGGFTFGFVGNDGVPAWAGVASTTGTSIVSKGLESGIGITIWAGGGLNGVKE